jgi:hypothetical protein
MTRTGNETVELEGKKRPLTLATPLARRPAHHQHRPELRPAALLTAPGLVGQPIRSMGLHVSRFSGIVAESDDKIIGSNFVDERGLIIGLGPITIDPSAQNRGVGHAENARIVDADCVVTQRIAR